MSLQKGRFTIVVPIASHADDVGESLIDFMGDVCIPKMLMTDGAGKVTGSHTDFIKYAWRMQIKLNTLELGRKNQNHAAE
jgi:hypothetical protein